MAPPVFTVASQDAIEHKSHIHLLPCRIHHDGKVSPTESFWDPKESQDGMKTAYIRGRKLHGKAVKLPEGYYGSVVEKSAAKLERPKHDEPAENLDMHEESDEQPEVGAMQGKAAFDEMMIWGHESTADSTADPYVRSMEEWITVAEQINTYPSETDPPAK